MNRKHFITGVLVLAFALPAQAVPIAPEKLEEELTSVIAHKGGFDGVGLNSVHVTIPSLNTAQLNSIPAFAASIPATRQLDIGQVDVDTANHQFTALLRVLPNGAAEPAIDGITLTGRIEPQVEVPVLSRHLSRDDIIREGDITYTQVPERQIKRQHLTRKEDLLGRMVVKPVSPGQLISGRDVEMPRLITKGNLVEMLYRTPYMELKTTGQALQNGAKGDLITVKNTESGKVINALVLEDGRLLVNYSRLREQVALTATPHSTLAHSE